jgi:hypothetical protein
MIQPVYIVDLFAAIVAATSTALLTQLQAVDPLITGIRYEYGHYNDIRERIIAYGKTGDKSVYPLIALFEDFKISHKEPGLTGIAHLKLIIVHLSKKGVTRVQRETNVFRPILYPIYNEFLNQLKLSGKFMVYPAGEVPHEQINRPHWGDPELYKGGTATTHGGYIFNDILDGIEISNLDLKTYLPNCQ